MARHAYREQFAVERRFVIVELAERWFALASRALLLLLALAMGITTVICVLRGSMWPLPAGSGIGTGLVAPLAGTRRV
jgi:hypothetical protein